MSHKILFLLNSLEGGGAERVTVNIANQLVKNGYEVLFVLGEKKGIYLDLVDKSIPVGEIGAHNFLGFLKKLPAQIRKINPDYIFTASHSISAATIISRSLSKSTAKIIATIHYDITYQLSIISKPSQIWLKTVYRRWISKANHLIAVSNGVADGIRKVVNAPLENLSVIFNPIVSDSLYENALLDPELPVVFENKKTIINIGRLDSGKNQSILLSAHKKLLERHTNLQLLLLGIGNMEMEYKSFAEKLEISESVSFLGFQKNPFAYLKRSDLFVLCSQNEGLPTVIVEALALGVNVVSTDCPSGPAEILENGKYGFLCPVNDADALAKAIDLAFANPIKSNELVTRAKDFSIQVITSQYLQILEKLSKS